MMFALGCIQALRCNTNACPTGVATQDPELVAGLHVGDKAQRVARYHKETVKSFFEVLGAAGCERPSELESWNVMRRVSPTEVKNFAEIYGRAEPGSLLVASPSGPYARAWAAATPDRF
jgi:hypothetical protein